MPDGVFVATALVNGLTLVLRNTKDLKNIQGLTLTGCNAKSLGSPGLLLFDMDSIPASIWIMGI